MTYATRANPPVAGSKNPLPTDVNATLPDRLAEHSGATGSKFVPYTYADGRLAPGFTPGRDPEMTARGGGENREGEHGASSLGQRGFNAPAYGDGPVPDRTNVGLAGQKSVFPLDVNAPDVTQDPETPVSPTGLNVPDWGGSGGPSGI